MPSIVLAALLTSAAVADAPEPDTAWWGAVTSAGNFDPKASRLHGWFEQQTRTAQNASELRTLIFRSAIGVGVVRGLTLWGGAAWVPVFQDDERTDEARTFLQLIGSHRFASGFSFQSRTRFEQRRVFSGDDWGLRLREFVRIAVPLHPRVPLVAVAWDEMFFPVSKTDWGARPGFGQNRAFVGLGHPFADFRIEVGYANIQVLGSGATTHVLLTALFHNF